MSRRNERMKEVVECRAAADCSNVGGECHKLPFSVHKEFVDRVASDLNLNQYHVNEL